MSNSEICSQRTIRSPEHYLNLEIERNRNIKKGNKNEIVLSFKSQFVKT